LGVSAFLETIRGEFGRMVAAAQFQGVRGSKHSTLALRLERYDLCQGLSFTLVLSNTPPGGDVYHCQ